MINIDIDADIFNIRIRHRRSSLVKSKNINIRRVRSKSIELIPQEKLKIIMKEGN